MQQVKTLSLSDAQKIISVGMKKAEEIDSPSNIAVVDVFGYLIAHIRMDGAQLPSIEHAINKARTSALFKKPTVDLKEDSEPKGDLYGLNQTLNNSVIVFAGGVPVYSDNILVGAVGVSGGTSQQDNDVANFAADGLSVK